VRGLAVLPSVFSSLQRNAFAFHAKNLIFLSTETTISVGEGPLKGTPRDLVSSLFTQISSRPFCGADVFVAADLPLEVMIPDDIICNEIVGRHISNLRDLVRFVNGVFLAM
jgi:hypothetical protein